MKLELELEQRVAAGLASLAIDTPEAIPRLVQFVVALDRWNKVYNLTAVREPRQMVSRHINDSLAILPWLRGQSVLDVGSGAGLPGIPLALVCPERRFTLLDSNAKRTRFMIQMQAELGLSNIEVVRSRVEDYQPTTPFPCVVSRAFASIDAMLARAGRLCARDGVLLAMKGAYPSAEMMELPADCRVTAVETLDVPGLDSERHLVFIQPLSST